MQKLRCDCCDEEIGTHALRFRDKRDDVGPNIYTVVLNGHENHWLTATEKTIRQHIAASEDPDSH